MIDFIAYQFTSFISPLLFSATDTLNEEQAKLRAQIEKEANERDQIYQQTQKGYEFELESYHKNLKEMKALGQAKEKLFEVLLRILNQGDSDGTIEGSSRRLPSSLVVETHRAEVDKCKEKVKYRLGRLELYKKRVIQKKMLITIVKSCTMTLKELSATLRAF